MELHERALEAYVKEPLRQVKRKLGGYGHEDFANRPEEKVPLNLNIASISDNELGKISWKVTRWCSYFEELLSVVKSKVEGCKKALEYVKSSLLQEGTKKEHIPAHPSYIAVNSELQQYQAEVETIEALLKRYNNFWKLISREISRRNLVFDKEKFGYGD